MRTRRGKTEAAIVDWGFNAWGGKYPPYDDDDAVPTRIAEELKLPVFYPGIVMEGGAVDFNGAGTVLTTTDCLLNKNRNPELSKKQIEQYLKTTTARSTSCWLTGGIEGDDTDGHIDDLARFIIPPTIVIGIEDDPKDANYRVLQRGPQAARRSRATRTAGRSRSSRSPCPARRPRRPAPAGDVRELLLRQRRAARADVSDSSERPQGASRSSSRTCRSTR